MKRAKLRRAQPRKTSPAAVPPPAAEVAVPAPAAALDARLAAQVATGLWRMRNRMVEPGTDRPLPDLRAVYRHLQSTWDALTSAGIEIQSHDGEPADPGLALSVVAYQPTAGLDRDRIVETIRPTVYLGGRVIQQGEVIVGTPADGDAAGRDATDRDAADRDAAGRDAADGEQEER